MFQITPIPAFDDNYIWMLQKPGSHDVVVVDPGDATPVLAKLKQDQLQLQGILITHHHADHTGGADQLAKQFDVPVYGPANSPYKGISQSLVDGDSCEVLGQSLSVRTVPGHTLDHISYFIDGEQPQLLCGDTLFLAGCGRLFEGSPQQMLKAMNYFSQLPDNTQVFCTHEYSLANLAFAEAVEPENAEIQQTISNCQTLRKQQKPTLPSSIAQERLINPFLRTQQASVRDAARKYQGADLKDEEAIFAAIREWKNNF
ncbi:MAG: hydroxyacylglutathione hydrolase [Motiliproteus sp.]|nr:hydroxyacylglutathione hydrolase [Motiliproteus sp.]MCW9052672.1 hydroxyacylglutathione hydrolase [Motiliproteus sp.]